MDVSQGKESQQGTTGHKRMEANDTGLLVIDVQEKLITPIKNKEMILVNIKKLIDAGKILKMNNFFTEQNPNKLGSTVESFFCDQEKEIYAKMSFSCFSCETLIKSLEDKKITNLLLCGIETHVCVLQTALDLISCGFNIYVAIDAMRSRNTIDHDIAIRRLQSAGAILATTESAIFEWCKTADRVEFKEISKIIKST